MMSTKCQYRPKFSTNVTWPGGVGAGSGPEDHESQNGDADDHVQRVHAGHGEVEEEVDLGVPRHVERQRLVIGYSLVDFGVGRRINEGLDAVVEAGDVVLLDLLLVLDAS